LSPFYYSEIGLPPVPVPQADIHLNPVPGLMREVFCAIASFGFVMLGFSFIAMQNDWEEHL